MQEYYTVRKSVMISPEQDAILLKYNISFTKLVRSAIDEIRRQKNENPKPF